MNRYTEEMLQDLLCKINGGGQGVLSDVELVELQCLCEGLGVEVNASAVQRWLIMIENQDCHQNPPDGFDAE